MMNIEALKQAMINLNGNSGLLLWLYLNKNDDKYFPIELSQKASEAWGIKKDSYYRAVEELIAKGYLVGGEDSNLYTFYEVPVSQNAKEARKQISDSAKEISQSEKDPSHSAIEPSHQP